MERRQPPGQRPERRRTRKLSDAEHDRLIWRAMHTATELDRPAPPHVAALDALIAWMHSRGFAELVAYADDHSMSAGFGDNSFEMFKEAQPLIHALREAEADPRYGRWLFLRVSNETVERRYDTWPDWWEDNGISGPWRTNLADEVARRGERRRPSWVPLLDPDVAFD